MSREQCLQARAPDRDRRALATQARLTETTSAGVKSVANPPARDPAARPTAGALGAAYRSPRSAQLTDRRLPPRPTDSQHDPEADARGPQTLAARQLDSGAVRRAPTGGTPHSVPPPRSPPPRPALPTRPDTYARPRSAPAHTGLSSIKPRQTVTDTRNLPVTEPAEPDLPCLASAAFKLSRATPIGTTPEDCRVRHLVARWPPGRPCRRL